MPLDVSRNAALFNSFVQKSLAKSGSPLSKLSLDQQDVFISTVMKNSGKAAPGFLEALKSALDEISTKGNISGGLEKLKPFLPQSAAAKNTSKGIAVMTDEWSKPIVFPEIGKFKWLGWADEPSKLDFNKIWSSAYKETPSLVFGAVGNSNIKPEQISGGCSLSKAELSKKYEEAIQDFYKTIIKYLKENGAKTEDIGFAFAHSDCGVDKAARTVCDELNLKGLATTPTRYTQYLRGTQMSPTEKFPAGYVLADFPYPTVLTRGIGEINDYASTYNKMVGNKNPLGVFGGGSHSFIFDTKNAIFEDGKVEIIPCDIVKDKLGFRIPATDENGVTINAARKILEKVDGNPYQKYEYAFSEMLPDSPTKSDIAQYDPLKAQTVVAYNRLKKAGKI